MEKKSNYIEVTIVKRLRIMEDNADPERVGWAVSELDDPNVALPAVRMESIGSITSWRYV